MLHGYRPGRVARLLIGQVALIIFFMVASLNHPALMAGAALTTPTPTVAGSPPESIYRETIPTTKAQRITISEIELMRDALALLVKTRWDGNKRTPLPLSIQDFDTQRLKSYIADEKDDQHKLTIPPHLEKLYLAPEAAAEISRVLLQARAEYVDYLRSKGALAVYVEEINQTVLPPDPARLIYHPKNNPSAPPSATGPVTGADGPRDYGRLQIEIYPVDIYNLAMSLGEARILGEAPANASDALGYARQLRDIGLRQLLYHEMTHVLQRAYINVQTPAKERKSKSAAIYASKVLSKVVDTQYHWKWGTSSIIADINNEDISSESQADGISYEILVNIYNMSAAQRAAVWDHLFGRLETGRAMLNEIRTLCETHYQTFLPDVFGGLLSDVMQNYPDTEGRHALTRIALRLSALPSYVGYMNPMLPQDTPKFWNALKQR